MKALTILQPYAHLIVTGKKWVENREWETLYRGPILIHAGKSHRMCDYDDHGNEASYEIQRGDMAFGAIVGIADLVHCYLHAQLPELASRRDPLAKAVLEHEHSCGSFCWALKDIRRFPTPIPYPGAQGLFTIPDRIVAGKRLDAVARLLN